jgi:hypothetical protein
MSLLMGAREYAFNVQFSNSHLMHSKRINTCPSFHIIWLVHHYRLPLRWNCCERLYDVSLDEFYVM